MLNSEHLTGIIVINRRHLIKIKTMAADTSNPTRRQEVDWNRYVNSLGNVIHSSKKKNSLTLLH